MSLVERLGPLLARRLGVHPPRHPSEDDLAALVEARRRALGLASVEAYLERVALALDDELWHLAAAVTNGWTWFFRDHAPLVALAERVRARGLGRPARVWVAGCSTGEEAYGAAIACLDHGVDVKVVGTDVDAARIEIARRGLYGPPSLRRVPTGVIARHFAPVEGGELCVSDALRARVELRLHNLLDPPIAAPEGAGWDVIVCRNVLLHCTEQSIPRIVARLEAALAEGGALLLGPADPRPASRRLPRDGSAPPELRARSEHPPARPSVLPPALPIVPARSSPRRSSPPRAPRDEDRWARVVSLVGRGAHVEARDAIAAVLAEEPTLFAAHATLGNLWLGAHCFDRAARAYQDAEVLEPTSAELHFLWGALHRKRGAWAEATVALRRALFFDEDLWPARFFLAGAWERLGADDRREQALEQTLRSLARRPHVAWRSCVDEIESIACPAETVRDVCLRRLGRDGERKGARDGG